MISPPARAKITCILALLSIGGCVSSNDVRREEIYLFEISNQSTFSDNMNYARRLAHAYLRLSTNASAAQDVSAVALIGIAAVAAGGLVYDASLDLIKGAGLAAASITATNSYFRPGEASEHLLDAAEQLLCIIKAGDQLPPGAKGSGATEIAQVGILTVRVNLRKKLQRKLPDYKTLVLQARSAASTGTESADILATFRASVAECIL